MSSSQGFPIWIRIHVDLATQLQSAIILKGTPI